MDRKKVCKKSSAKKKMMSIELKREIIEKHEQGVRVVDLSRQYGRSTSMICSVLKRKESIKSVTPAKDLTIISKLRTSLHENMEKLLMAESCNSTFVLFLLELKLEPGVSVEEEIVSLGKSMGLEVEERDVNELIEEHTQERTTEEIQELQSQQHTEVMQVIGFEESEEEVISTSEIK
ncbi:LSAMP [Cordylochernes scorpioides]|uniref:LSAMP n=1 Tax=Cordylochernes scorpioides TaxID=51811 RepID=A0ABY6LEQ8_9ARAC|nr:LSAMP [Cordylochernes scorpioides]